MKSKIVILWCHPRSISTAFARAFEQRQDFVVFYEPFSPPAVFGPERMSNLFDDEVYARYADVTYANVMKQIITEGNKDKRVFIKGMAVNIIRPDYQSHPENPTMLSLDFLLSCQHTFLVCTPEKAVPSQYHTLTRGDFSLAPDAYLKEYTPAFNGYAHLEVLFDFLTELTGTRPPLFDATDLLCEPQEFLTKYCNVIEDQFEPSMLTWRAGKIEVLKDRTGFHDDVEQSTGFNQMTRRKNDHDDSGLPEIVHETIKKTMPIYEKLIQFKMSL